MFHDIVQINDIYPKYDELLTRVPTMLGIQLVAGEQNSMDTMGFQHYSIGLHLK